MKIDKSELSIRFKEEIYFPSRLPLFKHFVYAYGRALKNLVRSIIWLFYSKTSVAGDSAIGVYATENQKIAVARLDCQAAHISSISRLATALLFLSNLLRFVLLPILYIFKDRLSSFELSFVRFDFYAVQIILRKIEKYGITSVILSNDHAGPVFYLSILLRNSPTRCIFVQHGDLKLSFPSNTFEELWVRDNASLKIAKKLCSNVAAKFHLLPEKTCQPQKPCDVLIILSHPFRLFALLKLKRTIKSRYPNTTLVLVRFHPSTRFKMFKRKIVEFIGFEISECEELKADILRCKICIGAMSSALREAVDLKNNGDVIWSKNLGLSWDYYGLSNSLEVLD